MMLMLFLYRQMSDHVDFDEKKHLLLSSEVDVVRHSDDTEVTNWSNIEALTTDAPKIVLMGDSVLL
jgi:hypothetical protein